MTTDPGGMRRLQLGDAVVEFDDLGDGDAVLLVHGGVLSDWFAAVAANPELDGFRVIRMRRAGYVDGSPPSRHLTVNDHAEHCALLLNELGVDAAHVCGHSSGALITLELAIHHPDAIRSMVLLEPAPGADLVGPACQAALPEIVGPVMGAFAGGDVAGAMDLFLRAVGGDHYRSVIDGVLGPDGHRRALLESVFFFGDEVGAVQEWTFGPPEAEGIRQPMLLVEGSETAKVSKIPPESVGLLAELVPHAEARVLAGSSHLMPLEDPGGVARLVSEFAHRHRPAGV
jgi:pimeloyl-ACP methyl ester carboxylesterase